MSEFEASDQEFFAGGRPVPEPTPPPAPQSGNPALSSDFSGDTLARIPDLDSPAAVMSPIAHRRRQRRQAASRPPLGLLIGGGIAASMLVIVAVWAILSSGDSSKIDAGNSQEWTFEAPSSEPPRRWQGDEEVVETAPEMVLADGAPVENETEVMGIDPWSDQPVAVETAFEAAPVDYPPYGGVSPSDDTSWQERAWENAYAGNSYAAPSTATQPANVEQPSAASQYWGGGFQPQAAYDAPQTDAAYSPYSQYSEQTPYPSYAVDSVPSVAPATSYADPGYTIPGQGYEPAAHDKYPSYQTGYQSDVAEYAAPSDMNAYVNPAPADRYALPAQPYAEYSNAASYREYTSQMPDGNFRATVPTQAEAASPQWASRYADDPNSVYHKGPAEQPYGNDPASIHSRDYLGAVENPYAGATGAPYASVPRADAPYANAPTSQWPTTPYGVAPGAGTGYSQPPYSGPQSNAEPVTEAAVPGYRTGALTTQEGVPSVARFNGNITSPTVGSNPYERTRSSLY